MLQRECVRSDQSDVTELRNQNSQFVIGSKLFALQLFEWEFVCFSALIGKYTIPDCPAWNSSVEKKDLLRSYPIGGKFISHIIRKPDDVRSFHRKIEWCELPFRTPWSNYILPIAHRSSQI